ncbi:hypothetical protein RHSIM_Rhsim08G0101000 [Rhododendron simsii]|uniref:Uncharacterized protein n=1 Tax=Rhododendron simsii TaxID=118357 RepID=A0A834GNU5_RHOSS|nr:hypothetical protein RHSIM_Rhsim08G0101000 [Rhododendron simsii]
MPCGVNPCVRQLYDVELAPFQIALPKQVEPFEIALLNQVGSEGKLVLPMRTNIRSLSKVVTVPKSTLHLRINEGDIRPHTSAVKPYLKEEGKRSRLQFCVSMVEPSSLQSQPMFKRMYNYVHIDEKWFFLSKGAERYYLLPAEKEPHRTCKSKKFITKVMFLAAVARPPI